MSAQWQQVKEILQSALERSPDERDQFLDKICADDKSLRREVETLLASAENVGSFMEQAAIGEVAEMFVSAENDLKIGECFNHYEIIRQIGAGGMGEVYLAEDTKLHRRVALKLLPISLSSDQNANRRLLREARAAATLDHPHICQIHEIAETDGRSFIAMQFCEGETLAEKLQRENLSLRETLDLAIQIADALANAHSHHVIHRDIKPANIIVNEQGNAKILDFGLAKIITEKLNVESEAETAQLLSAANLIIGTPPYMSPEQMRGKPLDARSDIFSFGALLYEMLSGKQPFKRESHAETVSAVLNFEPPIARTLADTPQELQRIVRKSLAKDKEERYQTAKDLLIDLKSVQKRLEFAAELLREDEKGRRREGENVTISSTISPTLRLPISLSQLPANNLTGNLLPIIGREKEISHIKNLLSKPDVRLVTMAGVGGTGKTRLAQAVAQKMLQNFSDGVFFVELAAITNPELVASTIAHSLGVKEAGGKPILDALKDYLRGRQMLLVVDNFEQVVDAAPNIAELLATANDLKILITSRVLLHLSTEREFVVPPLAVPNETSQISPDELSNYEAIKLFVERARNAKPNFSLTNENANDVVEICARLDGLPLAIELAAARIKILSPRAILTKLENRLKLLTGGASDLPARQQTMRGAVEWSYDFLTGDEKYLFRQLAVFAGGFTFKVAEAVCSNSALRITDYKSDEDQRLQNQDQIEILDLITSLVDKSLLVSKELAGDEQRFRMLETVREYALESLEKNNEAEAMRRRHAAYFLALGEEADLHLQTAQAGEWLNRLEEEHDNLRAAIRWLFENEAETAARLVAAMRVYLINHCHLSEGREWLTTALEQSDGLPVTVRFKLLNGLGYLAVSQGDYLTARKMFEKNLAEGRTAGDQKRIAESFRGLGAVSHLQGDHTAARKFGEEGLAIHRELNDKFGIAASLNGLAVLAVGEGDSATARTLSEESLTNFRLVGNESGICYCLLNLGEVAYINGDYEEAQKYYGEVVTIAQNLGYKDRISSCLDGFAALAAERKEWKKSAQLVVAAEHLRETIGYKSQFPACAFRHDYIEKVRAALGETAFAETIREGQLLKLDEAVALCLEETGGDTKMEILKARISYDKT